MRDEQKRRKYKKRYHIKHKEREKEYGRKYRIEHKEEKKEYDRKYDAELRDKIDNLKYQIKLVGCYFCDESDTDVLDFAHVNSKVERRKGGHRKSYIRINPFIKYVEKCEVMCKNCHVKFDLGKLKIKEG